MIKLVAFDLDGTALDSRNRLTSSAADALTDLAARNIPAAAVSARSIRRTLEPFAQYPHVVAGLYLAGYNGSIILGPDSGSHRPTLHEERLDADVFIELVRYAQHADLNLVCAWYDHQDDGIVEEYRHARSVDGLKAFGGPGFVLDPDLYARCLRGDFNPPPMVIMVVDPARRSDHIAALKALGHERINVSWGLPDRVQIMRRGVDKGNALRLLAHRIGVPLHRVLAVGDADNALPMLRAAGIGVLMGSASESVQTAVKGQGVRIGPTLAEDGFAQIVREFALTGPDPIHQSAD